jgi:branched-subunit amino acid permease
MQYNQEFIYHRVIYLNIFYTVQIQNLAHARKAFNYSLPLLALIFHITFCLRFLNIIQSQWDPSLNVFFSGNLIFTMKVSRPSTPWATSPALS